MIKIRYREEKMKKILFLMVLLLSVGVNAIASEVENNPNPQEKKDFVVLSKTEQAEFDKYLEIALDRLRENDLPQDFLGDALLSEATYRLELTYGWGLSNEQKRAVHYAVTTLIPAEYNQTMPFEEYSRLYADIDWAGYRVQCSQTLEIVYELVKEIAFNSEDFGKWFQRVAWYQRNIKIFGK